MAYRTWTITIDPLAEIEYIDVAPRRLFSLSRPKSHVWITNGNWAKCVSLVGSDEHAPQLCTHAPNRECKQEYGCGLYSYANYKLVYRKTAEAKNFPPRCIGIVWAWGTLKEHTDGTIRSEIMDIWALCGIPYLYPKNTDYCNDFIEIATRMKLPYHISESKEETLKWLEEMSVKLMEK